jgi:dihydroorotase-like cyclic amidohydrolase
MKIYLITNAILVNEGQMKPSDVLIAGERIERIGKVSKNPTPPWASAM